VYDGGVAHFVVIVNLGILAVGVGVAFALLGEYRARPSAAGFWQLFHFASFTLTMAVAAMDAYAIVNIGLEPFASRLYTAVVLWGCAGMLFSFVFWNLARSGRRAGRRFVLAWVAAAAVPAAVGLAVPLLEDLRLVLALIALSFIPFVVSVLAGLRLADGLASARPKESFFAFTGLLLLAAAEVAWISFHPEAKGHFFVTLPVAYLYVCRTVYRGRVAGAGASAEELPEALALEMGLTEREREMARGILAGMSNKELAHGLGIAENTARNHIYNLYRKLGIQKRLDLVLLVRKYRS